MTAVANAEGTEGRGGWTPHLLVAHRNGLILHALRALHLGCLSLQARKHFTRDELLHAAAGDQTPGPSCPLWVTSSLHDVRRVRRRRRVLAYLKTGRN